jgi:predicted aspartyl protease
VYLASSVAAALAVEPIADVPFRYEKNTVLVEHVRINGKGDYTFLVDTGSTACTVTTEVADELGLPRDGWSDVSAIGATRKLRVAKVQSIAIGNARVSMPLTLIADDNGLSKHVGTPVHGVLGTPFLWRWPVQVDYPARRLRILPREYDLRTEPIESPWSSVGPLAMKKRAAYVKVAMNGALPHDMMLDTGATGIVLSEDHAREAKAKTAHFQSSSIGAFGPRRESQYWRLDTVRVAGLTIENAQAFTPQQLGDWQSDQLGNDALDQFRLTVDASRRIFRLERDQMAEYFENSPWGAGVSVRRDVDGIRIVATWPGGEAAAKGIASGDAVVMVNDQDAGHTEIESLKDLLNQPPGYTVSLSVRTGDGSPRTVLLRSQRYTRKRPTDSIATSVSVVQPK